MQAIGATRAGSNNLSNRDAAWLTFEPCAKRSSCMSSFDGGVTWFPFSRAKKQSRDMRSFAQRIVARIERSQASHVTSIGNVAGHDFNTQ